MEYLSSVGRSGEWLDNSFSNCLDFTEALGRNFAPAPLGREPECIPMTVVTSFFECIQVPQA